MSTNVHRRQRSMAGPVGRFLVFTFIAVFTKLAVAVPVLVNWTHLSSANGDLPVPPLSDGQSGIKVADYDLNGQNDYIMTLWDAAVTVVCDLSPAN